MVNGMKVAFVGAGPRAVSQAEALRVADLGRTVGVWNRTFAKAERFSSEHGGHAFTSIGEMVEQTRPDLVSIVTHPASRVDVLREAIDGGASMILLEKPIALTRDELEIVRAMGEECFIAVNTQYPWMAHWRRVRELVRDGALGDLRAIRASTGVDILEQGPHSLSLALSTARAAGLSEPSWVLAGTEGAASFGELEVPANTVAVADLGAARLQLLMGDVSPRVPGETNIFYQQQVEVVGSRGRVWVSLNQGWEIWMENGLTAGSTRWPRDDVQSQADLFADLADIMKGTASASDFTTRMEVAARDAALLFACIESGETGRMVRL